MAMSCVCMIIGTCDNGLPEWLPTGMSLSVGMYMYKCEINIPMWKQSMSAGNVTS